MLRVHLAMFQRRMFFTCSMAWALKQYVCLHSAHRQTCCGLCLYNPNTQLIQSLRAHLHKQIVLQTYCSVNVYFTISAVSHNFSETHSVACYISGTIYLTIPTSAGEICSLQFTCCTHPFTVMSSLSSTWYWTHFLQGVNLPKVIEAGDFICSALFRKTNSKVAQARSRNLWCFSGKKYIYLFDCIPFKVLPSVVLPSDFWPALLCLKCIISFSFSLNFHISIQFKDPSCTVSANCCVVSWLAQFLHLEQYTQ